MIPAKARDLIPGTAEQLGIPQEDLSNMVSFYFKENKKKISNLEHLQFVFRGLGVMKIKGWTLQKEIDIRREKLKLAVLPDTVKQLTEEIAIFTKANEKWIEEEKLKKEARQLKNEYYANKKTNDELEGKITTGLG